MDILFDTSVLIAGTIQAHPRYNEVNPWLVKAVKKKVNMIISSHSIAEYYSVATKLPVSPRMSPSLVMHMIKKNLQPNAKFVHLTSKNVLEAVTNLSNFGFPGGIVYDSLIFHAAKKAKVQHILTLNPKVFKRFCLDEQKFILVP